MGTHSIDFWKEHFAEIRHSLVAQIERILKASDHTTIKGTSIEVVIRRVLRDYLPGQFSVGSGQIANIKGELSPQQDILVYEATAFPHLSVNEDSSVVICCESLLATIECKTAWQQGKIENHFQNTIHIDLSRYGEFNDKELLPAYFVLFYRSTTPKLDFFKRSGRTIGFHCVKSDKSWVKTYKDTEFRADSGTVIETFFRVILMHCMRIGQIEVGDFSSAYKAVARYIGWQ